MGATQPTWPYFFISYAHLGNDDELVQRFYRDLSQDVLVYSGADGPDVGFCDSKLQIGELWSPALVTALRSCQVFVALCGPTYFQRASCGKEWTIFTRRLASLEQHDRSAAASLIPLRWVSMEMPEIAKPYQYRDADLGKEYERRGLRPLIHLDRNRDDYKEFVAALANRIVNLAHRSQIPPYPDQPDFDAIPAAFPDPSAPIDPPKSGQPRQEKPRRTGSTRPTRRASKSDAPEPGQARQEKPRGTEDTQKLGHAITFYSYKGGTGRTMALANVAWILAANGYRVLTIDWDLESPGLHRFFHPFLRDKELHSSEGVVDLVRRYADATLQPEASSERLTEMARIQEYAVSLDWEFPDGGVIDFVPAGRQDDAYSAKVSTFDWDSFWGRLRGGVFIDALRTDMRTHYDYILIDSRTGTSDTAGICTVRMPDTVVNFFTLNKQNIDGAAAITRSIIAQQPWPIRILPVPTRIDDGERAELARRRSYTQRAFRPHLESLGEDSDRYWDAIEIPYIPYYAYGEVLATFGDQPGQQNSLLSRYLHLTSEITASDCLPPSISDSERALVLRRFEQAAAAEPLSILVAYAPLDRIWAEWLRDRLGRAGHHVTLHGVRLPMPSLERLDRLITVFSRDYIAYEEGTRPIRLAGERLAAGSGHDVITLRVDATPVPPHVQPRTLIDVMGMAQDRALEMLFTALGEDFDRLSGVETPGSGYSIRYPSVPAPRWNLQLARNSRFSGRGAVLEEIRDHLQSGSPEGSRLALTGLPGVGKTQIALEYMYRFAASYDTVWWISATQPGRARVALADLAKRLDLKTQLSVEAQVAAILDELRHGQSSGRWLLVFDNADAPEAFQELLPSGPGHLIVTSRNPQWSAISPTLDVNVFDRAESVELLRHRVHGMPTDDASRLAARLGDLPLAIEQAGGWLATTGMTVSDYLEYLDRGLAQAMDRNAPADYSETVTSAVRLAYEDLFLRSPAAARLVELFAMMGPDAIPYRLMSNKRLTELLTKVDPRMYDPLLQATLNREIGRYALARIDAGTGGVVMHRLTQEVVRQQLSASQRSERRAEVQAILAATERGLPDDLASWQVYEALRPHLQPSGVLASDAIEVRQLVIDMASYLRRRGDYSSSEELASAALDEWPSDDPLTLRLRYELGATLRELGRDAEAHEMNRDSHEQLLHLLGEHHPYTLITASSFAADLRARGDYHEARELDERTLTTMRTVLGDDDPFTLNAVNNLAVSMRMVGEYAAAAKLDREALERRRKVLGAHNLETLNSAENYAADLRELGDLLASRNTLETTYTSLRTVYGEDHPRALQAAKGYAVTLRRLGEVKRAANLIFETTVRLEAVLGHRHPQTIAARLELAWSRWAQNELDEARRTADGVYRLFLQMRGPSHPFTLAAGNDLSIFRRGTGDLDGSLRLAEETSERLSHVLGPRHPRTIVSVMTLANALYALGSRVEARRRDGEAYGRLRKVLEEDHPTVLAAAVNHAISHRSEQPVKSESLRKGALLRLQTAFGDLHPHTVAAREWLRIDIDIEPLPT